MRVIISNDRLEVYKYSDYSFKKGEKREGNNGRKGNDNLDQKQKEENSNKNRKATLTEARNNIIRLIKCNGDMQTFITLTFSYDVDYQGSKKYIRKFFRKLNDNFKGCKYIWILELTKRKRVHYHILTNADFGITHLDSGKRKSEKHKSIEREVAKKYWGQGFVDIRNLRLEENSNIALYVASYVVKDLLEVKELRGQRVYGYSYRTLDKPTEFCYWSDESLEEFIKHLCDDYELTFTNSYKIGEEGNVNYFDMREK